MNNNRYRSNSKLILAAGLRRSTLSIKRRRLAAFGLIWLMFFVLFDSAAYAFNPSPVAVTVGFTVCAMGTLVISYSVCNSIR